MLLAVSGSDNLIGKKIAQPAMRPPGKKHQKDTATFNSDVPLTGIAAAQRHRQQFLIADDINYDKFLTRFSTSLPQAVF